MILAIKNLIRKTRMPGVPTDQWLAKEIHSIHMLQSFVDSSLLYVYPKRHAPSFPCIKNKLPVPWKVDQYESMPQCKINLHKRINS